MANGSTRKALSEITIDTILTMVVRLEQPMTVKTEDGKEYDLIWNRKCKMPEVLQAKKQEADIRGITQTLKWLEDQSEHTEWYPQTKRHKQPNA